MSLKIIKGQGQLVYNNQTLLYAGQVLNFYFIGESYFRVSSFDFQEEDMSDSSITCDLLIPANIDPDFSFNWYV